MAKLKKISISDYKSLHNIEFELNPLNIMIGANGSGKSNLISLLRLLRDAADEGLSRTIGEMGGFKEVVYKGSSKNPIEVILEFDDLQRVPNTDTLYYKLLLGSRGNGFTIQTEELSRDPYPTHARPYIYLGAYNGVLRLLAYSADSNEAEEERDYNDQELAIARYGKLSRYPAIAELRNSIADWTIFRGFGENALRNIYDAQPIDGSFHPLRLNPDGTNLVAVLHTLRNEVAFDSTYEQLMQIISNAFPDFKQIDTPSIASGRGELRWRLKNGWSFPASSLSDGMLRFLGLATLLTLPEPPALIAIDEPEVGLHPELIPLLAGLLKSASKRTQIIVTTHSPELLGADVIELDDIVLVSRENGETHFNRPDADRLKLWLERYTIGNLWTMGKLV